MLKLKEIPVKKPAKSNYPMISSEDYRLSYSPSFSLIDKQVPEIADWEVGKKYQMIVEVEMTGKNEVKERDEKIGVSGNFNILSYKTTDDVEDMSDEDVEKMMGKARSS